MHPSCPHLLPPICVRRQTKRGGRVEKAALGSRTDTPKGLIGLQLMLVCGGSLQKKERDEVCDGQAITSTGGDKGAG